MSDNPEKPKKKRIGLFLPVPWDKDGRLISSVDPNAEPAETQGNENIVRPPDSLWKEGKDTPPTDDA